MKKRHLDYFSALAEQKWVYPMLFVFSFLESIILPIPLELVLVPLMLHGSKKRTWALAGTALLGFLAGASFGYITAMHMVETLAPWLLPSQQSQQYYQTAVMEMQQQGFWYLFLVGLTPLPTQIAMLAAGSTLFPFGLFLLAMLVTRSVRYFSIAWVMNRWGKSGYQWLSKHQSRAKKLALALLVLVIVYEVVF
ncbi:YqaA family protein [Marinospirillum perlucidum]|uniref:YqaA family protein n=1 Tax=Marinospirillum perlucidum TaxID=1982602 RepID=UPI000DF2F6A9|nr:DedA family protein [Marinospirillum perlucidum]